MSSAAVTPSPTKLTQKQIRSYIMRTTGPQPFYTQPFATLSTFNIPKNIPLLSPLAFIQIRWKGRLTVTTTFSALPPEAPQNILQQIQLQGTHSTLGFLSPIRMSGASLFAYNRLFTDRGNSLIVNGIRQPELNKPMGLGNAFFTSGGSPYDMEIFWNIPLFPNQVADADALLYLYNAAAWGQTLQLQIQTADTTAFGGTGVGTFSAFGSASGSPAIDIMLVYASMGPLRNSVFQAVRVLNTYQINTVLQSNATNTRLQLLQNQRTLNVTAKTGTLLAGTSAGVTVFGTLSDTILEQAYLRVNNNPIRNLQYDDATAEFYGFRLGSVQPTGYLMISFEDGVPQPNPHTGFRGERLPGSSQFDIAANVVGAAGTNVGEIIQEMIYGEPQVAGASST
jgi:hypothetical protein